MTDATWVQTTALSDGEVAWGFVPDGDGWQIQLQVSRPDVRATRIADRWHGNFGGSSLAVTPDESHATLFVYSGQDEAECMVFRLQPDPELRVAMEVVGEPVVSPDSRFVGALSEGQGFLFDADDDDDRDWWEPSEVAEPVFELAVLTVHDLADGQTHTVPVHLTFRTDDLMAAAEDDDLEQWAWDNLDKYALKLELGADGLGAVVTPFGTFTFTATDLTAPTLGVSCTTLDDPSSTWVLQPVG